jgi:hypothetical protein
LIGTPNTPSIISTDGMSISLIAHIEAGDLDRANELVTDTVFVSDPSLPIKAGVRTLNLAHLKVASRMQPTLATRRLQAAG